MADKSWTDLSRLFAGNLDALAALSAASLTRAHAFDLPHAMRDRPVVARRLRQGMEAAWDHALDAGQLPPETPNWWGLVLRGKLPSRGKAGARVVKRVLSDNEVGELLRWLPNFSRDVDDMLTLYLWTCCRGAEIVAMERTEITHEVDSVWWTVPRAILKMRRNPLTVDLRVPVVGRACALVMRRMDAHAARWVFPSRAGGPHCTESSRNVGVESNALLRDAARASTVAPTGGELGAA